MIAKMLTPSASAVAVALVALGAAHAQQPVAVPLNGETTVDGVPTACTGVGQTKLDPKWLSYPVRIEFADAQSAYLGDVEATLTRADGAPIATVRCEGPWVLFKLPRGHYRVQGSLTKQEVKPQTSPFTALVSGQIRVVLHFPDA